MTVIVNPYLNFRGHARDAITFYQSVFGGELQVGTFGDFGASQAPDEVNQVMHAQLTLPSGLVLMASDVPTRMPYQSGTNTFSISVSGDDAEAISGYFATLADGGTVFQPLEKAPWGDRFGMLSDRFGVSWIFNIASGQAPPPTADT